MSSPAQPSPGPRDASSDRHNKETGIPPVSPNRTAPGGPKASAAIFEELSQSMDHVMTVLSETWGDIPLSSTSIRPASDSDAPSPSIRSERTSKDKAPLTKTVRINGPDDLSLQVHFVASPLCPAPYRTAPSTTNETSTKRVPYEISVGLENGPTIRYTLWDQEPRPSQPASQPSSDQSKEERPAPLNTLGRKVTAFLLREIDPRIGEHTSANASDAPSSPVPRITLDREGRIVDLTEAARTALEYEAEDEPDPNFFSHVDGHNLRRVMCDLAQMVAGDRKRAQWLLRMETGTARWRWYRASVRNKLRSHGAINVTLLPLGSPLPAAR